MKQIIKNVLDDMSESQINLGSETARKTISSLISAALKTKGCYTEYDDSEIEEQNARATWVCSICGENTADVDYDYLGSGTNHLGCELKSQKEIDEYIEDIDEQAYAQGRGSSKPVQTLDDGGITYKENEPELKFDTITEELYTDEPHEELPFREKNWLQKKHEDKVFGHDQGGSYTYDEKDLPKSERHLNFLHGSEEVDGMYFDDEVEGWEKAVEDMPEGLKRAKELSQEALKEGLQKQAYMEMTSDGLPEGGDTQAVLESQKLAEQIVEAQEGTWIYESPDGGKTVFRRPFSDYDPKNKEEIDWETKEPTGRKFTEYNGGNWNE